MADMYLDHSIKINQYGWVTFNIILQDTELISGGMSIEWANTTSLTKICTPSIYLSRNNSDGRELSL